MTSQAMEPGELRFTRIFEAPRELVFRCMIEPGHLAHFWGPIGTSAPLDHITVEAKQGGRFETVMISDGDGSQYPTSAVYEEVTEPERLVWTEAQSGMRVTITFAEAGRARTEVSIHQTNVPAEYRSEQAQAGFLTSLDRFAWYLTELRPGGMS
jgi:uncharacterized protein YndB with AHSA1/START domain